MSIPSIFAIPGISSSEKFQAGNDRYWFAIMGGKPKKCRDVKKFQDQNLKTFKKRKIWVYAVNYIVVFLISSIVTIFKDVTWLHGIFMISVLTAILSIVLERIEKKFDIILWKESNKQFRDIAIFDTHWEGDTFRFKDLGLTRIVNKNQEWWVKEGWILHREDGPAAKFTATDKFGRTASEITAYFVDGILHRIGGPAVTYERTEVIYEWWVNGENMYHRKERIPDWVVESAAQCSTDALMFFIEHRDVSPEMRKKYAHIVDLEEVGIL